MGNVTQYVLEGAHFGFAQNGRKKTQHEPKKKISVHDASRNVRGAVLCLLNWCVRIKRILRITNLRPHFHRYEHLESRVKERSA